MYVYEATLEKSDKVYIATVPQFDACYAEGKTVKKAVENIATVLKLCIAGMLDEGKSLPKQKISKNPQLVLCVEVNDDFRIASKCLSISEAGRELGVTHGRVCQMLDAGMLEAFQHGGRRMVTIASVEARKKENPQAGRPIGS